MLDIQLADFLAIGRASGTPDLCDLPPAAARGLYRTLISVADRPPAEVHVENRTITGPATPLQVRIYRPSELSCGIVLYLHGGGFALGDLDGYQGVCSHLCAQSGCTVVAVNYRLAPEAPFPAAVDDSYAALEWVASMATELGGGKLAVVGDSAGGNLSAVMTLLARERGGPKIDFQALIYPVLAAAPGEYPSYDQFGAGYVLTRRSAEAFNAQYFPGSGVAPDYRGAPLLATHCADLPPALIQVAGYDPLHDEGVAYAERLMEAGVPVSLVDYPGLSHGYINMTGKLDTAELAFEQLCSAVRQKIGT
ncbi:MAG TPA: alpha/beta hydrolase [Rhodocyclaceae bacterium]|nr:alpha/beta hydrolase [Rhodocyclaceae bacterium]